MIVVLSVIMLTCQPLQVPVNPEGWEKIEINNSEAKCSHGTPYIFWVRRENPKKLVIFFRGGGFCWNYDNCIPATDCFQDNNKYSDFADCESQNPNQMKGIFDFNNANNPFSDYSFVVIPYCTADFHWGNNNYTYQGENQDENYTIYHQGFVNAQAVLEWTYREFPHPKRVLIAGSSAGSFGSILHANYIMEKYSSFHDTKISRLMISTSAGEPKQKR